MTILIKAFLNELKIEATLVEQGVELYGEKYFDSLETEGRITWIDSDGKVLYDTDADAASLENHKEREEVEEAFEYGSGSSQRYSRTFAERNVYYAELMNDGTVIRVSSSQYSIWSLIMAMVQPVLFVSVLIIILSVFLAAKLSTKIVKPINDIDLDHPDIDEDYPEISPLLKKISKQNLLIDRQMKALRKNEEAFMTITSNMSEGLIIIDKGTGILSFNNGALKLLGKNNAEIGESVFTLERSERFREGISSGSCGKPQ